MTGSLLVGILVAVQMHRYILESQVEIEQTGCALTEKQDECPCWFNCWSTCISNEVLSM